jgi:hypothetical protein
MTHLERRRDPQRGRAPDRRESVEPHGIAPRRMTDRMV